MPRVRPREREGREEECFERDFHDVTPFLDAVIQANDFVSLHLLFD